MVIGGVDMNVSPRQSFESASVTHFHFRRERKLLFNDVDDASSETIWQILTIGFLSVCTIIIHKHMFLKKLQCIFYYLDYYWKEKKYINKP